MAYQHIVFDLYGTLVDIRTQESGDRFWGGFSDFLARHGADIPPGQLSRHCFNFTREAEEAARTARLTKGGEGCPEIRMEPVFAALYMVRGIRADPSLVAETALAYRKLSTEYIRLYPGADTLLRDLRAAGKGVWLLSNAQSCFTLPELDELGIRACFDGIFISSDYGCKKPDKAFFDAFLGETGVDPGTAVMVGNDGVCDVYGAHRAGLAAVYLRTGLSPAGEPDPGADYSLAGPDMDGLRRILLP